MLGLNRQKTLPVFKVVTSLLTLGVMLFSGVLTTLAQPTQTINYQAKLTDTTGMAVTDGTYNMRFWLLSSNVIATTSAQWTEVRTGGDKVQVTNGLFSVMLGDVTSLASVDFNQPLYLGVEIGGTGSPAWDGEMSPRKVIGTVPSAFEAKQLGGVASSSFLRSDQADSASGLLTFTGGIISSASSTVRNLTTLTATTTNLVINSERFTDLTGTGLQNTAGVLSVNPATLGAYFASTTDFDTSAELAGILTDETGYSGGALAVFSISPTITGTADFVSGDFSSTVTLSGSAANIVLGSNYLNGDSDDEGISITTAGRTSITGSLGSISPILTLINSISSAGSGSSLEFQSASTAQVKFSQEVISAGNSDLYFSVRGSNTLTERMRLTAAGSLGVGTSTPSQKLTVVGGVRITGALVDNASSTGSNGYVLQSTGSGFNWVSTTTLGIIGALGTSITAAEIANGDHGFFSYSGGVASLDTGGVTSSNVNAAVTDETGGGSLVFGTSPTFTTQISIGSNGVRLSDDGDGAITFLGLGNGSDENLTLNLDDTVNTGVVTSSTGLNELLFTSIGLDAQYIDTENGFVSTFGGDIAMNEVKLFSSSFPNPFLYIGQAGFGGGNVAVGAESLGYAQTYSYPSLARNTIMGSWAASVLIEGVNNVAIGDSALGTMATGSSNTAIGQSALNSLTEGHANTVLGASAGGGLLAYGISFSSSTFIGYGAGYNATSGASSNILLGYQAADNLTTGNNNIIIGYDVDSPTATVDNILNIGNIIFGAGIDSTGTTVDANATIGIGTSTPWKRFSVAGDAVITGRLFDTSGDGGTNGQVLLSTGTGMNWVATSSLGISGGSSFTNSAQLAALLSDETGSAGGGLAVFSISPTLTGTLDAVAGDFSSTLTMSGTAANIALGDNFLSNDGGDDEGISIDTAGRIAITTTNGATTALLRANNLSTTVGAGSIISFENGSVGQSAISQTVISAGNSDLYFSVRGSNALTEQMRLSAAGNLGIGTSTPNQKLTVQGHINLSANNGAIYFDDTKYLYASSTNDSVVFGELAGATFTSGTTYNVAIGFQAGRYASTSAVDYNNFIGAYAGYSNTGSNNSFFGSFAGVNSTGSNNSFIGYGSGNVNTSGANNSFLGYGSGNANTTGSNNSFFGYQSGVGNSSGIGNSYFGYQSGLNNETGRANTAIGYLAGEGTASNSYASSTMIGYGTGLALTTGSKNILLGYQAADNLTTGNNNIIIGYDIDSPTATADNILNIGNLLFGTGLDGTGTTLSSGHMGIGTTSPMAKFGVVGSGDDTVVMGSYQEVSTTSSVFGVLSELLLDSTGSAMGGTAVYGNAYSDPTNGQDYNEISGVTGLGQHQGFGDVTTLTGVSGAAVVASGTVSVASALNTLSYVLDGTVTELIGVRVQSPANFGTVTNAYGVYIEDQTLAGTTLNYNLYSAGGTAQNMIEGSLSLGTAGVRLSHDGDGALTLLGMGNGTDEDLTINLDDTANTVVFTSSTGLTTANFSSIALQESGSNVLSVGDLDTCAEFAALGSIETGTCGTVVLSTSPTITTPRIATIYGGTAASSQLTLVSTTGAGTTDDIIMQIGNNGAIQAFRIDNENNSVMLGEYAGATFTSGTTYNVAIGYEAGRYASTTDSDLNIFIGRDAGESNAGGKNILLGHMTGQYNTGDYNNILGAEAGNLNTGEFNNIFGWEAGYANTGDYNNIFGSFTGYTNTGDYNNIIGYAAGQYNNGDYNEFIGYQTSYNLRSTSTVAIGAEALYGYNSGGTEAMYTAINNVAIGYRAGYNATNTADNNILIGYQAADNLTTGNNNIIIGYDIDSPTATADNILNIGNIIFGAGIDASGTTVDANATIGIGTSTPWKRFSVAGDAIITGALFDSSGDAGTNGQVLLSTGTGMNWVATSSLGLTGGSSLFTDGGASTYLMSTSDRLALGTTTANQALTLFRNAADTAIEFSAASGANYKWTLGIDYSDAAKFKISSSSALGTNDRFVIDGSGNVGIGTASPADEIHLRFDQNQETNLFIENNTSGGTAQAGVRTRATGSSYGAYFGMVSDGAGSLYADRATVYSHTDMSGVLLSAASTQPVVFATNGTERGRFTGAGNFGIGTTTPSSLLTTYGTNPQLAAIESSTEFLRAGVGETSNTSVIGWDDSDAMHFGLYDSPYDTTLSNLMTILATGNVGIGTTTPDKTFQVWGTAKISQTSTAAFSVNEAVDNNTVFVVDTNTNSTSDMRSTLQRNQLSFNNNGGGVDFQVGVQISGELNGYINMQNDRDILLMSNGTAVLTMDGNLDYVGIGTTSPSQKLTVYGTDVQSTFMENSTEFLRVGVGETAGTSVLGWHDASDSLQLGVYNGVYDTTITPYMTLESGGEVGIGTTAPQGKLHVENSAHTAHTVFINNGVTGAPPTVPNSYVPTLTVAVSETTNSRPLFFGYDSGSAWTGNVNIGACGAFTDMCFNMGNAGNDYTALKNVGTTLYLGGDHTNSANDGDFTNLIIGNSGATSIGGFENAARLNVRSTGTSDILNLFETGGTEVFSVLESGTVGVGTSTPYAKFGIHSVNGSTETTLFAIASSTASVTSSLFTVSNAGHTSLLGNLTVSGTGRSTFATNLRVGPGSNGAITSATEGIETNTSSGGRIYLYRDDASTNTGDNLGIVYFGSNDGPTANAAAIVGVAAESFSGTVNGSELRFSTTLNGAQTLSERMRITNAGLIGIGTTTPISTLSIQGSLCVRDTGACGTTAGTIYATTAAISDIDLAENYRAIDDTIEAGELVALDTTSSSTIKRAEAGDIVLGVISTAPGLLLGQEIVDGKPVALKGRVPVKINMEGGDISIGDAITLSSVPGVGTKATTTSYTVGIALDSADEDGIVEMFVQNQTYFSVENRANLAAAFAVIDENEPEDTLWSRLTTLAQNFVDGVLTVAGVRTNELCVGDVCVDEDAFLQMVESANSSYSTPNTGEEAPPPEEPTPEPPVEAPAPEPTPEPEPEPTPPPPSEEPTPEPDPLPGGSEGGV